MAMDNLDIEIHPAVDADVINAKKIERQKAEARRIAKQKRNQEYQERVIERLQEAMRPLLWRGGIAFTVIILLSVLSDFDLVARPLTEFLVGTALAFMAICLGAGLQYILCERGYMK